MDKNLAVKYEVDKNYESARFVKLRIRVCHDGENYNYSALSLDAINKAKDSIANIPILAHVVFDDNGKPQFGGHDMYIDVDPTGEEEYRLFYEEIPIGVIPETNNYAIEQFDGRNYVCVDGYIWKDYSNLAEYIINRDDQINISMEISVNEYLTKEGSPVINITDYVYRAVTLLGKDISPGMKHAVANRVDFTKLAQENFLFIQQELFKELSHTTEKDTEVFMDKKKELIADYGLTLEDLDFDLEEISYEELENKLKEEFSAKSDVQETESPENEKSEDFESQDDAVSDDDRTDDFESEDIGDGDEIESEENKEEKDAFSEELQELKTEFEEYKSSHSYDNEFVEEYKSSHSYDNEFVEDLKLFKNRTLTDSVLDEFKELSELKEFQELRKTAYQYEDLEALREKCFAIKGRNIDSMPKADDRLEYSKIISYSLNRKEEQSNEPYGGLVKQNL